jgi:Fe-S oxidoreductase
VDIATYKAEFLAHFYEKNRRPLFAHAFGKIDKWLRLASVAPRAANFFNHAPGFSHILRSALHLAPQRQIPRLASASFLEMTRRNPSDSAGKPLKTGVREVILWVDTFNNHFHPETLHAALEVLTRAGFAVTIPARQPCCGRPLYDFGMLDEAKRYLERILEIFAQPIDAGTPIVVLEPSCASVFRDELRNLYPDDSRAARLRSQTFLLSEFLERHAAGYEAPRLPRKVLLHGHCHQKALMKMTHAESLLRKMGADLRSLDSGCCGMAGPFGFEREEYPIAQAAGERVLLPAVRQASADTVIVSDGFSCREQILQSTGRRALHLAEAIQLAGKA